MSETTVVYEQFEQGQAPPDGAGAFAGVDSALDVDLRRLSDVPMELSVEIGRTQMTVRETLELRAGSIVTLDRLAGEAVDLLVNGTLIARGEVIAVDEQFGLRITEILEGDGVAGAHGERPAADPAVSGKAAPGATADGEAQA